VGVVGVADARQQPEECGVVVRAQDGKFPKDCLRTFCELDLAEE
jgi:hypothetical protein